MSIAIVCCNKDPEPWRSALLDLDPGLDLQVWPDEHAPEAVDFALCWRQPEGVLKRYPNLKGVCSMGAGVDNILTDATFPRHLPLARIVDPKLSQSMFEYIATCCLDHLRQAPVYRAQQRAKSWQQLEPQRAGDHTVGIMGLGLIGAEVANKLAGLGFQVAGWSRTAKSLGPDISCFYGEAQKSVFLGGCDILVCLLPLTETTKDSLNAQAFDALPKGACLINVARGEQLCEHDLLSAMETGQLSAAYLDVFREEPLPPEHAFWHHSKIHITPHIASITDPSSVAPQVLANYRRLQRGEPLRHQVDIVRGY